MPPEAAIPRVEGLSFREAGPRDAPFLRALFRESREAELTLAGWDEARKAAFADAQFDLQDRHYRRHYDGAAFLVIERAGAAIGRLSLCRLPDEVRVMDMALAPAERGRGLGSAIMAAIAADAAREGAAVTLHVEQFGRARAFYARLGFREEAEAGIYLRMRLDPPLRGG